MLIKSGYSNSLPPEVIAHIVNPFIKSVSAGFSLLHLLLFFAYSVVNGGSGNQKKVFNIGQSTKKNSLIRK